MLFAAVKRVRKLVHCVISWRCGIWSLPGHSGHGRTCYRRDQVANDGAREAIRRDRSSDKKTCGLSFASIEMLVVMGPGVPSCVKTYTSRECGELFSLCSSFDGDCREVLLSSRFGGRIAAMRFHWRSCWRRSRRGASDECEPAASILSRAALSCTECSTSLTP